MAAEMRQIFNPITGLMKHEGGRVLNLNGLSIDVPKRGFVFIGFALVPVNGVLMSAAVKLSGPSAMRYGALRFGEQQLNAIVAECKNYDENGAPFTFSFNMPRPKISKN